jgi:4-hydroxythreonine-4-phosphate dehydrogenase
MSKKKVIITSGDPAGCGPLISLRAIEECLSKDISAWLIGDRKILERFPAYKRVAKKINLIDLKIEGISKVKPGYSSKLTGFASLAYINNAFQLAKSKNIQRIVTAPISKEAVKLVFGSFKGHTEYLASRYRAKSFAMMMSSKRIKTVLLTRHISLKEVPFAITKKKTLDTLSLVYSTLQEKYKIKEPKIVFASINPHAGVNTFMEREEKKIAEAVKAFKKKVFGPYPADTIFVKDNLKNYHCVICAYHDQAMIPFKLLSLKDGVNLTLGLPIIRTSPAHGVAFDLMKNAKTPFHSSMAEAIRLALRLIP